MDFNMKTRVCCTYSGHVRYVHYTNVVLLLEHIAHLHCDVPGDIHLGLILRERERDRERRAERGTGQDGEEE
jgi:hypothetical protein